MLNNALVTDPISYAHTMCYADNKSQLLNLSCMLPVSNNINVCKVLEIQTGSSVHQYWLLEGVNIDAIPVDILVAKIFILFAL